MATIKHVVLFKFKDSVSDSQVQNLFGEIKDLQSIIPGYQEFIGGSYSSPEGLNKGYNYAFILTFAHAESRDSYIFHPEHDRVKAKVLPLVDDIVAFDFEVP
ncbi:MAG: Dabb family protein [Bryobacteraceae bacterium]|nr:Dabb family protein [Bryobacteraceae bacterium]